MAITTINYKDFLRGESTSDLIPDRGFSPVSGALNLTRTKGMFYFMDNPTNISGGVLTGNISASADDFNTGGNDKYFIDELGAVYTLDNSVLVKRQTIDRNDGGTFDIGNVDMVQFKLDTFITSNTAIHRLTGSDLATTENWWSGLTGSKRHPLEVVEKNMFTSDGNIIYFFDGTSSGVAFTLPTDQNVTSLRKHPNGVNLLAFTSSVDNFSHTKGGQGKVYYCDPTLIGSAVDGWSREVEIESQVEGTKVLGGIIYCTWGKKFGLFDGNGLSLIKELDVSEVTYSQNISNIDDVLIIRDGSSVLAYGDLGIGRVWWRLFHNLVSPEISNIDYNGDNELLLSYSNGSGGGYLFESDTNSIGTRGEFVSNKIRFNSQQHINKIEIIHDVTDTSGNTRFQINQRNMEGGTGLQFRQDAGIIEDVNYVNQDLVETIIDCDIKTSIFQFKINPVQDDIGFKEFRIYHDPI